MRILITAGPTHEYWDDVRFLGNRATGRLGIELANACTAAGHAAVLVLGPTHLPVPEAPTLTTLRVVSARDMLAACLQHWPRCNALVATAAVCDFRPAERVPGKRAKTTDGDADPVLHLTRNPDILATLAVSKGDRPVIGFALQVDDGAAHARRKLVAKNLDAIVLDSPAEMAALRGTFTLIPRTGEPFVYRDVSKAELAAALVRRLVD